ncbi:uncharacterized protein LOC135815134 isoform X1 [Sycon ciliatum]|uniref:uncharacterized protein LOC135815134 isoform X1 n=1 Tax=Sycon ciliatum TaxID=27933 RepID=UPI0031F638F6
MANSEPKGVRVLDEGDLANAAHGAGAAANLASSEEIDALLDLLDPDGLKDPEPTLAQERDVRFNRSTLQEDRVMITQVAAESKNTVRNTRWGVNGFETWRAAAENQDRKIPSLYQATKAELDYHLPKFINEARRRDGAPYPANTLYQVMCSIQRELRSSRADCALVCFVDFKQPCRDFPRTVAALEAKMKSLTQEGYGDSTRPADVLTIEDERRLWEKGIFSAESAGSLLHTVFYYVGKLFGLGLHEQEHLMLSQVMFGCDCRGRFVSLDGGKNKVRQGALEQHSAAFESVQHYDGTEGVDVHFLHGEQQKTATVPVLGLVHLVSMYCNHIAQFAAETGDTRFYHRPLVSSGKGLPWFSKLSAGHHALAKIVPEITRAGGLHGNFTSDTPKASCPVHLLAKDPDGQPITEEAGPQSVNAVHERAAEELMKLDSNTLEPAAKRSMMMITGDNASVPTVMPGKPYFPDIDISSGFPLPMAVSSRT